MPGESKAKFSIVGTPIGNLSEFSYRAESCLRDCDEIFCEDTRRSLKLLNHYEIKKPLTSVPYFKEKERSRLLVEKLQAGAHIAYVSDAGMPALSDPGSILLRAARDAGFETEVVGGPSSLTSFIAGLGYELSSFRFVGFLPPKSTQRRKFFESNFVEPHIFFESPHRIQKTLILCEETKPDLFLILGKELSKISEAFFQGTAGELLKAIPSWKGEWVGLVTEKESLKC